uniref:C-type lectin domain-containing protein n=1 Tax=Maylandia zebra TaxID=106582 RepID=A0A3P9D2S8_9CICH
EGDFPGIGFYKNILQYIKNEKKPINKHMNITSGFIRDTANVLNRHQISIVIKFLKDHSPTYKKCPAGWTRFNHSCYLLSESSGSWDAAVKDCRDRGTYLVVIDFPEEQTFLSTIINEVVWIGLNDKEQEGTWKWVDGTPLSLTYWADHQPDGGGGKEDCVHVRKDEKKSWNDLSCSTSLKWVCEKTPNHCTVS